MNRSRRGADRAARGWRIALMLPLLSVLLWPESSVADDRVLLIQDGNTVRVYPVSELIAVVGLTEVRVAQDPHFGPDRVFTGFALGPMLEHVGLGDAAELLLVCADGYRIPFEVSVLARPALRALLAVRDTALPADGETHWPEFRHGNELIRFDPFYLVWVSTDASIDLGTETLPWPFQLTEIHRFDPVRYFASASPPADADEAVREGFGVYTRHCGKCHRMGDVGGGVGPALDRQGSLSSALPTAQLRDYVRHDEPRFPYSKMPPFSKILSPTQIDQVVSYLQAMQAAR